MSNKFPLYILGFSILLNIVYASLWFTHYSSTVYLLPIFKYLILISIVFLVIFLTIKSQCRAINFTSLFINILGFIFGAYQISIRVSHGKITTFVSLVLVLVLSVLVVSALSYFYNKMKFHE